MKNINWIVFACFCLLQLLINNFFAPSQYLLLSFLPLIIVGLPLKYGTIVTMLMAFATGLGVDVLSSTAIGISACALLPVALLKNVVLYMVGGEELLSNHENSPLAYQTFWKNALTLFILCALYFAVYVWIDAAGTRSFGFNTVRWCCSVLVSGLLSCLCASVLYKKS